MKPVLLIFFIVLITGCTKSVKTIPAKETVIAPSLAQTKLAATEVDTLVKTSNPFKVNGIACYWQHYFPSTDVMRMVLKKVKTEEVMADTDFILLYGLGENEDSGSYFDAVNKACLVDVNFDGFTDFKYESIGSNGPMSNSTVVHLFNLKTKTFDYSEELSEGVLLKVDAVHRRLMMRGEWRGGQDSSVVSFGKLGVIKSKEVFANYLVKRETAMWHFQEHTLIVDGVVVKSTADSSVVE